MNEKENNSSVLDDEEHSDFYRKLRGNMREWIDSAGAGHKWAEYLMFAPDLFYLLAKLVVDSQVPTNEKVKLAGVIAYFISPFDLVPEGVVGPIGYIDDIVLTAYVLQNMLKNVDASVIRRHWPGEHDVLEVIDSIVEVASSALGTNLLEKLFKKGR